MKIGFIGLGNLGAPMAANLAKSGLQVTGFDPVAPMPDGVTRAATAPAAARGADVVFTMLPKGDILRSVAGDIVPAMTVGAALCDCSTVDLESTRAVADLAQAAGLVVLDAPVSGGIGGARAGTLTFMDQLLPEDVETTSNNFCRSSPSLSARAMASHVAIMVTPRIMLLQILAACPAPEAPQ